jgi:hypothetical protein
MPVVLKTMPFLEFLVAGELITDQLVDNHFSVTAQAMYRSCFGFLFQTVVKPALD